MRKRLPIIPYLFFLILIFPQGLSAREYSLNDLYRLALERSKAIKLAEENLYLSEREKDKAKSVLFPKLSAFGSYTRFSEEKGKATFVLQPEYTTSWGLRLDQSLSLSGRELTALRIAEETITKTQLDLDSIREDYLLKVASAYFNVLKAKKAVAVSEATVERLKKHRDAAEIRFRVGEVTRTILLRAEAELSRAQSDLIRAENALKVAKAILARIVGITGDYSVREASETNVSIIDGCPLSDLDCFREKALSERSEIRALKIEKRIAMDRVKYARGAFWPTLSIEGVYSRQESHPSTSFAISESAYAGLKLDFPFFDGGLRRAEVLEAKIRLRQAELALEDLQDSIAIEVEEAYYSLMTESSTLEKLQARVTYASDNYRMVSKQFKYGLASSIDVIDANTLLLTSEMELADAKYDYQMAVLRLKRAIGTLLRTIVDYQQ
jgi:outer membrane protein